MNDSARENPISGEPQATPTVATVECPQCGTQLRLLRPATVHTPIACCICEATFYLQPIETAPMTETVIAPRRPVNGQGRPAFRNGGPAARRPAARAPGEPPPPISSPLLPPPSPGTRSAPGMPRPVDLPDHMQRSFRTRWMESVLGAALVLLLVVAACAGGFVLFRTIWNDRATAPTLAADAIAGEDAPGGDSNSANPAAAGDPKTGPPPTILSDLGTKTLPRPESLAGRWESRVDDGSNSSFVFRSDGTVEITQAGDSPPPTLRFTWNLLARRGDELVLDIGAEIGAAGNTRLTIRHTSPEAFTLIKSVRHGVPQPGGELRYVRTGPPTPPATAPSAAAPAAALPAPSP